MSRRLEAEPVGRAATRRVTVALPVGRATGRRLSAAAWAAFAGLAALTLTTAIVACRGSAAGTAVDPRREAVKAFWAKLHAANEARLRSGCASALALYEEALVLDPRHEDALYYLGQCRRESGQPLEARKAFERLVNVNPASARGHLALGALLASPDPNEPMDLAAAEAHLRRAHEINGEETGPVVRLGEVLLVSGRDAEARRWLEAALRTNSKSVEAAFLAGFSAWDGGTADVAALARRVGEAAHVETPVKGVLNEGDRRNAKRSAAPPLASPLGRLLFGAPIATLRGMAAAGEPIDAAVVAGLWRDARRLRRELAARASRPASSVVAASR
jgi:tetratricopeptide (TPR) repeat protein